MGVRDLEESFPPRGSGRGGKNQGKRGQAAVAQVGTQRAMCTLSRSPRFHEILSFKVGSTRTKAVSIWLVERKRRDDLGEGAASGGEGGTLRVVGREGEVEERFGVDMALVTHPRSSSSSAENDIWKRGVNSPLVHYENTEPKLAASWSVCSMELLERERVATTT